MPRPLTILIVLAVSSLALPTPTWAQNPPPVEGSQTILDTIEGNLVNPGLPERNDPKEAALDIINIALGFLGLLLILYLLYGGFTWMTSSGNSEKLEQAKAIIRNAIIGLVIVMASYGIAVYVQTQIAVVTEGPPGESGQTEPR